MNDNAQTENSSTADLAKTVAVEGAKIVVISALEVVAGTAILVGTTLAYGKVQELRAKRAAKKAAQN